MPIYIDRHFIEGATQHTLSLAHQMDLKIQKKYDVTFMTYWFDEARSTAFCLVEAPNKDAVQATHNEAHGEVANEIMEEAPNIVQAFLGRVKDPTPVNPEAEVEMDSAFRGIMFTDLKDSTLMTSTFGDSKALHLLHIHNVLTRNVMREHNGSEIKHTGDGFMISFASVIDQVNCAKAIQHAFAEHNHKNPEEELHVRIGLSAGEPIEEHGDLFGSAVQLAARLCSQAEPGQILASDEVQEICHSEKILIANLGTVEVKGYHHNLNIHSVLWQ